MKIEFDILKLEVGDTIETDLNESVIVENIFLGGCFVKGKVKGNAKYIIKNGKI